MSDHPVAASARELSPEDADQRVEACRALDQQVKDSLAAGRHALWRVAEALYEFDEAAGWRPLGFDSLTDWLAQPDVDLTKSTYYNAVSRWREVVVLCRVDSRRLENVDPSKIDVVLPAIRAQRVPVDQALEDARTLSYRALRSRSYTAAERPITEPPLTPDAAATTAPSTPDSTASHEPADAGITVLDTDPTATPSPSVWTETFAAIEAARPYLERDAGSAKDEHRCRWELKKIVAAYDRERDQSRGASEVIA